MGRERGDERGGDQAIWLDLVARLEQVTADEHAAAPWPDRENLGRGPVGPPNPANVPKGGGPSPDLAARPDDSTGLTPDATFSPGAEPGSGTDGPDSQSGKRTPANRGRVIRPAGFMRFADPPGRSAEPGGEDAGQCWHGGTTPRNPPHGDASGSQDHNRAPTTKEQPGLGADAGDAEPDQAEDTGFADVEPWRPSARNLSAEDYLNLADLGYIDYDTGDNDDRYIPPPLPPQPKLDLVAKGAWTALLGGPGYLFVATMLGWQVPGWAQLVAVIAFMAGFLVLVIRLGDGPSRRDGPDQGAVV